MFLVNVAAADSVFFTNLAYRKTSVFLKRVVVTPLYHHEGKIRFLSRIIINIRTAWNVRMLGHGTLVAQSE